MDTAIRLVVAGAAWAVELGVEPLDLAAIARLGLMLGVPLA